MHKKWQALALALAFTTPAAAFCGFFVAKADSQLFNHSNQVIIARKGDRSVFTMMNNFDGDVKDFARIVPIPVVPQRKDISIGDPNIVQKLEAFSAPRLVEYFDEDPCAPSIAYQSRAAETTSSTGSSQNIRANSLGVKIEAEYQVGEYDIQILSAKQQTGLAQYLRGEGYKLPAGSDDMLGSYLKSGMKFFVVKVNVERFDKEGGGFLNPIVLDYKSPRFMLPIRLGTLNSPGEQDLTVFLLTDRGRVETANYLTVPIPTDKEVPLFVKKDFGHFYKDMFQATYERNGKGVAFMEYSWNTAWCDPCATEPPTPEELKKAGAFWLADQSSKSPAGQSIRPSGRNQGVHLTRLHVRYTAKTFPRDLRFKVTDKKDTFQGRYIVRHAYKGKGMPTCIAGFQYQRSLGRRYEKEAQNLANLTNWKIGDIRKKMKANQ